MNVIWALNLKFGIKGSSFFDLYSSSMGRCFHQKGLFRTIVGEPNLLPKD